MSFTSCSLRQHNTTRYKILSYFGDASDIDMAQAALHDCVVCEREVRPRQEALCCDTCNGWQHRVCNTGISRPIYRQLVKGEIDIPNWQCQRCLNTPGSDDDISMVREYPCYCLYFFKYH